MKGCVAVLGYADFVAIAAPSSNWRLVMVSNWQMDQGKFAPNPGQRPYKIFNPRS
jgi:hypothetical protein